MLQKGEPARERGKSAVLLGRRKGGKKIEKFASQRDPAFTVGCFVVKGISLRISFGQEGQTKSRRALIVIHK